MARSRTPPDTQTRLDSNMKILPSRTATPACTYPRLAKPPHSSIPSKPPANTSYVVPLAKAAAHASPTKVAMEICNRRLDRLTASSSTAPRLDAREVNSTVRAPFSTLHEFYSRMPQRYIRPKSLTSCLHCSFNAATSMSMKARVLAGSNRRPGNTAHTSTPGNCQSGNTGCNRPATTCKRAKLCGKPTMPA